MPYLVPYLSSISLGEVVDVGSFLASWRVAFESVRGRLAPSDVVDAVSFVVVTGQHDLPDQLLCHRPHEQVVGFARLVRLVQQIQHLEIENRG